MPRVRLRPQLLVVLALALALVTVRGAEAQDGSRGRELYLSGCAQCHGPQLEGVSPGRGPVGAGGIEPAGPPLLGVGEVAADFYLRTGYMPLDEPKAQPKRSTPAYPERDLRALVAFIASHGGPRTPKIDPERGSTATGLKLFTENCAGCHQIVGEGGLVTGAQAVSLRHATAEQIAQAVRVGPYVMPRFSEHAISNRELDSLVRYVLYTRDPDDKGGWGLGHLGPVPEGIVAWLVAGAALLGIARVIGEKIR
jgi:ubiquinol-cytochrome c reductase cytochrome c subunit